MFTKLKMKISYFIFFFVGIVDPYCSLECEVTWHPGFSSPEKGEFILQIPGGNTLTLKCIAHVIISLFNFL